MQEKVKALKSTFFEKAKINGRYMKSAQKKTFLLAHYDSQKQFLKFL